MRWILFVGVVLSAGCAAETDSTPSLARDVQPILDRSCAVVACHGGPPWQAGMSLTPDDAAASLVGAASTQVAGATRVVAGDPERSLLVQVLRGPIPGLEPSDRPRVERMPRDMSPLSDDDIATIEDWIAAGAPP